MTLNILKLNEQVKTLKADRDNLVKTSEAKDAQLADARKLVDSLTEANASLTGQVEVLKAELEVAKKSANRQAAETLAAIGVPEGTIKESISQEFTAEQVIAKFGALTGKEKSEFYQKHRATILRAQGL